MADVERVIRERIAELEAERTKLEAALAALTGRRQAKRRASPARSTSRRVGARAKPGQRRSQILGHLEKNPGARPSEIASSIGTSSQQVSAVIRKLHAEKLVRKRGNGYGLSRAGQSATDNS
jgi:DNA invertase Pin-like site-specific DNA recombinase